MEILGTSRVSVANKITLIESVVEHLHVAQGDLIVFIKENDVIYIKPAKE